MTQTRIYIVEVNSPKQATHLVEATNPAQALRYITKDLASCAIPTTKRVAELVASGVAVETA